MLVKVYSSDFLTDALLQKKPAKMLITQDIYSDLLNTTNDIEFADKLDIILDNYYLFFSMNKDIDYQIGIDIGSIDLRLISMYYNNPNFRGQILDIYSKIYGNHSAI